MEEEKTKPTDCGRDRVLMNSEYSKFEKESLLYSRNLATKFHYLSEEVNKIQNRLDCIEIQIAEVSKVTCGLGQACGQAFNQTKRVIQHLHEEQAQTREDLGEYGGLLVEDSWDIGTRTRTKVV